MSDLKRVLVTGVQGLVGNVVYGALAQSPDRFDVYGLARRRQPSKRLPSSSLYEVPEDKLHLAHLGDWDAVVRATTGMDVVVHMAADPSGQGGWESVRDNNIVGTYHVFEASRLSGVRRVIYASSIQVIFGYRDEEPYSSILRAQFENLDPRAIRPITHEQLPRPLNLYSCSKVWGEALAHMYSEIHGISCICLRIGWVVAEDRPLNTWALSQWCSQRDIAQLVERCVTAPETVRFDVFYGVSINPYPLVDIEHARQVLGYEPQDRAEDYPVHRCSMEELR
jgi:nucleoside-diphosphate-sugar epimerase